MLKIPFNGTVRVTGEFGTNHKGTDYGLSNRTAIIATADGVVIKEEKDISKKNKKGVRQWIANTQNDPFKRQLGNVMILRSLKTEDYGNYVKIDHGNNISTLYAHLDETVVSVGQSVKEGQLIGYSDSTGNSTGGHLHYEIRVKDVVINPSTFDYSFNGKGGETIKLYPLETVVEIVVPALYVRSGPSRKEPLSGSREIHKGDMIDVIGFVEGEAVEGNNLWYKSAKGNYFWAGGTDKAHPELSLGGPKNNMTSAERESRLHDLEVWKASLDARKSELEVATVQNASELADYEVKYAEFLAEPVEDEAPVEAPVADEVVEPVEAVETVSEEVVETEEDKVQKAKLLEMYESLKALLGK